MRLYEVEERYTSVKETQEVSTILNFLKGSRRLKKVKLAQVDSIWFKNKQEDLGILRRFKKV